MQLSGGAAIAMDLKTIEALDNPALFHLAEYYERTARAVRLQIAERNHRAERQAQNHQILNEVHQATLLACTMMKNGVPYERAMRSAAETSRISQATLEAHHKQILKGNKEQARRTLEISVMRLARSGLNNVEIASKLSVGRNRVGQIIQQALRA